MVLGGNVKEKQIKSSTKEDETVPVINSTSFSKDQIETRNRHFKLYRAALAGDWNSAEKIFKEDKIYITAKLSKEGETALHIAAAAMSTDFVKKLLEQMKREDLAIKNNAGSTAFFLAAASGIVEIVKAMMEKNKDLVKIRGNNDMLPLHKATLMGKKEMVEYLYEATGDELLDDNDRFELLISLLNHGLYDIALDLVERHPEMAIARDENKKTALHYLARMSGLEDTIDFSVVARWKRSVIYLC
ncbi:ankycorbin-like [Pistacia vera]|uniref:ankycorbin-like n=1 Tax=Pistacia vera TaxID=55513 RepID=UPI0012636E5B|nr:ankycorbin-like [Pistacia vera]